MEEKIEDILDNNMMYDGQLNKTKAITELLNLFSVSQQRELLIAYELNKIEHPNIREKAVAKQKVEKYISNL